MAGTLVALLFVALIVFGILLRARSKPNPKIGPVVSAEDRATETQRLAELGLHVPDGGIVLERPFEQPFTSRSLVAPRNWILGLMGVRSMVARYTVKVRASDVLADLDVLEPIMQRAYGGWDSAIAHGWSWDAWFSRWRARLRAAGTLELSIDDAFAPFDELIAFRRDNHSQVPLARFSTLSTSETYLLAHAPRAACTELLASGRTLAIDARDPAQRVREALALTTDGAGLEPARYVVRPTAEGPLDGIRCGSDIIPLEPSEPRRHTFAQFFWNEMSQPKRAPEVKRLSEDIVYAYLPTMVPDNYADVDKLSTTWPKPNGHEKLLIVDVRDDEGGDDGFAHEVLKGFVDAARLPRVEDLQMRVSRSCLYAPLKWGFMQVFTSGLKPPLTNEQRADLQERIDALSAPAKPGCPREIEETHGTRFFRDHHLLRSVPGMRIVLWTSAGCGSDCELLTEELAALPETAIVGANTLGVGQFTQPGYGVLPHSRLPFRIALGESDAYGDGRTFDGYGFDVDVVMRQPDWNVDRVRRIGELLR